MANVTGKVVKPFNYKGKAYKEGDEITILAAHAAKYERNNLLKLNREAEAKVEAAVNKKK